MIRKSSKFGIIFRIIIILSLFFNLDAKKESAEFDYINIEHLIPNSTVYSIVQDNIGFIWFGTTDGLIRYDGYNFVVYKYDPLNTNSISSNSAGNLFKDQYGIIWIGTWGGGLNRFDIKTGKFSSYIFNKNDPNSISDNRVQSLFEDHYGKFWFGTYQGGLNKFDPETEKFVRYKHDSNNSNTISNNRIWSIEEDIDGSLWIATSNGLNRFNSKTDKFIHYYHNPNNPHSISSNHIRVLFKSSSGTLWIGTQNGLNRFNPKMSTFTRFLYNQKDTNIFGNTTMNAIYEDSRGKIWIGTGYGLYVVDPKTGEITSFLDDSINPERLSSKNIRCIFEDLSGVMWVGTVGGGVSKFDLKPKKIVSYTHNANNPNSLIDNSVLSIFEDRSGILWIGTREGLNEFNRKTGKFRLYKYDKNDPNSLSHNEVWYLYEDHSNTLWVGTDAGLDKFNRKTRKFTRYQYDPNNPDSLGKGGAVCVYEDHSDTLWVGCYTGGLNKFDRATGKFIHYQHDPDNSNTISHNEIWCIYEDSSKNLWIGTGNGINKFDKQTQQFRTYKYDTGRKRQKQMDRVFFIFEDKGNILWIGSDWGLDKFDETSGKFTHFSGKGSLLNFRIMGIVADDEGNIWLRTDRGVSRFNPETKTVKNYNIANTLKSEGYMRGAFCISSRGEMFVGGMNGFNSFYPDSIKDNSHIPPIVITDFKVFNKSLDIGEKLNGNVILEKPITETKEIELSYKASVFSFEFAALDYKFPDRNKYAYRMEPFNKKWVYTDSKRRFVTYTNLYSGRYTFRVKGSNNDGIWNKKGVSVNIKIIPPFTQTLLFKIIILVFLTGIIFMLFKIRIKNIETQRKKLQKLVDERTKQLKKANDALEHLAKEDGLTGIANHRTFQDYLDKEWDRARREQKPISLIMADVDFFKLFNDTYGHQAGDDCLIMIAQVMKSVLNRPADLVARYGGEEFGIIMPNTDLKGGAFIAKKIKQDIIDKQISFKESSIKNVVTVSLGVATLIPSKENDKSILILSADKSLYQAKRLGRNRVHVFSLDQTII